MRLINGACLVAGVFVFIGPVLHAQDASRNLSRDRSCRVKGQAEEHNYQQGEKEHAIDRVFGTPFEAQILGQMDQKIAHERAASFIESLVKAATIALAARR